METFLERLSKIINDHAGGKHTVFATMAGIPIGTFQNYMTGKLPKPEYLLQISEKFDVNIDWLLTGKGSPYIYKVTSENEGEGGGRIAAPESEYDPHGGWKPRPEMLDDNHMLLGKAFEIIRSQSIYREALVANINAFFGAMTAERKLTGAEKDLADTKARLGEMEKDLSELRSMVTALAERKNDRIRAEDPAEKKQEIISMRQEPSV
jgi:hypothetical protein